MPQINSLIPLWKVNVEVTRLMYQILNSRTHNIVGEFAEQLVADALNGTLQNPSNKAYDILLPNNQTVQVKARKLSGKYKYSETLSDFHSWNFNWLIVVLFNDDGTLYKVLKIDSGTAKNFAHKRSKTSLTDVITLSKTFLAATTDITNQFTSYNL